MMQWIFDGVKMGLILTFLVGPLFFTLVQTGVEQGFRAGLAVAIGIWISDLLFIVSVYQGVAYFTHLIKIPNFTWWLGLAGSLLLAGFGIGTLVANPVYPLHEEAPPPARSTAYFQLLSTGFLINTINPFTVFFWVGLMTTMYAKSDFGLDPAYGLFGGILGTIMLTDTLKVALAKWIRHTLRPKHLFWLRRISGVALIVFGVALLLRVLVYLAD